MKAMKKISSILIILTLISSTILLDGCSFRWKSTDVMTSDEFQELMGGDYTFKDLTSQYVTEYPKTKEIISATNEDATLEVDYWRFKSNKNASQTFYKKNQRIQYQCPDDNYLDKKSKIKVAYGSNSTNYYRIALKGNTIIYCVCAKNKKSAAISIFSRLGFSN